MTKAEEMQRYDEFIRKLPQDSYLRPWLEGIRDQVETDLRNDIIPEITPRESFTMARQIIIDAEAAAKGIRERAEIHANRVTAEAKTKADAAIDAAAHHARRIRESMESDVRNLRRALDQVA